MPYSAYEWLIPAAVSDILTRVTLAYAREHGLDARPWHKDLPQWFVAEHIGKRTNYTSIDSVNVGGRRTISFTPNAYADDGWVTAHKLYQKRCFAPAEAGLAMRQSFPLRQFLPRREGDIATVETLIVRKLTETLAQARSFDLTDVHEWEGGYPAAPLVAIDGPAASGKSAVGLRVASVLKLPFVDTGAMYRAITWLALRRGVAPTDAVGLAALAEAATMQVSPPPADGSAAATIVVNGEDATRHLRDPAVEHAVSPVSAVPAVRAVMVHLQRQAASGGIVMAGRDIGTVVLPHADVKVYLDASFDVRVRRRLAEQVAKGVSATFDTVAADLHGRDSIDSTRAVAPLRPADDATVLVTDDLTIDEVVDRILALVAGV